jgi:peptide/nickel transport system ATP-binding protein
VSVQVAGLRVELRDGTPIVEDVSFSIAPGELLALVGESGAGKTTVALALLGFARAGSRISAGSVTVDGRNVTAARGRALARLRGGLVSYVPQNPSAALNPAMRVGDQVAEVLRVHDQRATFEGVARHFEHVSLPTARRFLRRFPHQLSGGQQQRVAIAMALACRPLLVVLDEPTTALDVVTQAHILELIARLRDEGDSAFVYVTHDVAAVAGIASSIAVLYAGRVVEAGPLDALLFGARHPYTRALVRSVPRIEAGRELEGIRGVAPSARTRPSGCAFAPRCELVQPRCVAALPPLEAVTPVHSVRCVRFEETGALLEPPGLRHAAPPGARPVLVVDDLTAAYAATPVLGGISFALAAGECLAVVGESGSGKTTLARCVVGLHRPTSGAISLDADPLAGVARQRGREQRRRVQIVFQNPDESLNPRVRVRDIVARPARQLLGLDREAAYRVADELLLRVRLDPGLGGRFPSQLSGGERQRVSIARALVPDPSVLVCDEVTSALDVSVQAVIVELIGELCRTLELAVLFISHDLAVVSSIADRVLVLDRGRVCELGETRQVVEEPADPYTRALIAAAPEMPVAPGAP